MRAMPVVPSRSSTTRPSATGAPPALRPHGPDHTLITSRGFRGGPVNGERVDGVAIGAVDGVLRIRLDRPTRKNALDVAAIDRVVRALEAAAVDDGLRVVVLSGTGDDFCA